MRRSTQAVGRGENRATRRSNEKAYGNTVVMHVSRGVFVVGRSFSSSEASSPRLGYPHSPETKALTCLCDCLSDCRSQQVTACWRFLVFPPPGVASAIASHSLWPWKPHDLGNHCMFWFVVTNTLHTGSPCLVSTSRRVTSSISSQFKKVARNLSKVVAPLASRDGPPKISLQLRSDSRLRKIIIIIPTLKETDPEKDGATTEGKGMLQTEPAVPADRRRPN